MIPKLLENDKIRLKALVLTDYDCLFQIAADKDIWAQHPDSDRYLPEGFVKYFTKLLQTDQPYLIIDKVTSKIIGATSYYQFDPKASKITIGYTFLTKAYWGTGLNNSLKSMMLAHAFTFVDHVIFHVRENNMRSQAALNKIGARRINSYPAPADPSSIQFEYAIGKTYWLSLQK